MGMYDNPPYYLTAYSLAQKRGFKGSLDEWLDSLKGEKGDSIKLRVSEGRLQWKAISAAQEEEENGWEDIIDLSTIEIEGINDTATAANTTWSSQKIADEIAKMATYEAIKFTSLTAQPSVVEIGDKISQVVISWELSAAPTALTIEESQIEDPSQTGSYTLPFDSKQEDTFTITASASDGVKKVPKDITVPFCNGVYYGAAAIPNSIDSAFIRGLTRVLRDSNLTSFTTTAADDQHIWYCVPKRFGECRFKSGGIYGGFEEVVTVSFTNASGHSEDYYVYRSTEPGLGKQTLAVE